MTIMRGTAVDATMPTSRYGFYVRRREQRQA